MESGKKEQSRKRQILVQNQLADIFWKHKIPDVFSMGNGKFQIAIMIYLGVLLVLYLHWEPHSAENLRHINDRTANILSELVKTKYFKLLRLNLNSECPLPIMNKLCKSKSCSVCRCDEKDIPQMWMKTDKVKSAQSDLDVWSKERYESRDWVWHVEDQQNDKGQYFDVDSNVESFSGYNGSYIWKLIYEENCFGGNYETMCLEEKVMYKIISGLHTSISSHLSRLHKNITTTFVEWADRATQEFYFSHQEYQRRVLNHPDRIDNLLFLYELLIRAVQQTIPYIEGTKFIDSQDIAQDLRASQLLNELIGQIKNINFVSLNETDASFFIPNNSHVKQYQRYIHNISSILNCVQCEKCRLFGKMQTYGLGTALKILLGYNAEYKRNQIVALFNTFNKISISVNTYYHYQSRFADSTNSQGRVVQQNQNDLKQCPYCPDETVLMKVWASTGFAFLIFLWIVENWNGEQKVKKMFKNVFPKQTKMHAK